MKKTLFALLACAMVMPAMAANWMVSAKYSFYGENNTPADYTLYLYQDPTASITSTVDMTNIIADMTLSEFTAAASGSNPFAGGTESSMTTLFATTLPQDSTPSNSIWGVCVYNGEDAVFSVTQAAESGSILRYNSLQASYTAFKADSPTTPEPATATLSLLALAGLATRRKRK